MTEAKHINRRRLLVVAGAAALQFAWTEARGVQPTIVLFICEHGYAKSLVAALHFERLAAARNLRVRAFARGVEAGAQVPPPIEQGLASDGFRVGAFAPARFTDAEVSQADFVVLISVAPDLAGRTQGVLHWDDVSPLSENYERARGELVAHLTQLLDRIETDLRA